ncbi:MAG: hypothetical protein DKM50_00150 [Candidatus Margulisiibacteriota bacterium]|nr:MAG: hypothetical protein A2X43_02710 [Candidatus Margulisbacteria bacterium GWD2_39_127]OGI02745.1 MAG: hypothetical protein A2X42_01745 [Candidatus Margulisbacteria bacterium GWF2_38_17]OGI09369.1 MAG: hypothetical protein A2X41_09630 [Candidatus Margulisbacteria bacterium GWE2_39_32]PZM84946.1 MAG: hypothetical protein DKM50_00150 [Candidatus Margulisiibacteriota bacterium]HAR63647.1 hypothetical protein [Candidatus Margulisiibacteriota bacterium]
MKITFVLILLIISYVGVPVHAQNKFGIGIIVGEPTGLSFKNWVNSTEAIDGAIAWDFRKDGRLTIHTDYLFHKLNLVRVKELGNIPVYMGIGARINFEEEDTKIGIRIPFGIAFNFASRLPFDVFIEVVPALNLIPATEADINIGLGTRVFF